MAGRKKSSSAKRTTYRRNAKRKDDAVHGAGDAKDKLADQVVADDADDQKLGDSAAQDEDARQGDDDEKTDGGFKKEEGNTDEEEGQDSKDDVPKRVKKTNTKASASSQSKPRKRRQESGSTKPAQKQPQKGKRGGQRKKNPEEEKDEEPQASGEPTEDTETLPEATRPKRIKKEKNVPAAEDQDEKESKPIVTMKNAVFHESGKYVGAHVSIVGGLENAILNAVEIGAKAFGLFLKSQRQWNGKPLSEGAAKKFRATMEKHGFLPHLILPHGSYLLNCGSPKEDTLEKSRAALIDELKRCEMLGLCVYNFHPGSTCGEITIEECIDRIAESINLAHKETKYVTTVIENMCGQGNTIGGDFRELRKIIDKVTDKSRIGVCLDTCHAFAAGYDLSQEEGFQQMMDDFESQVGFEYLRALHLNDSKGKVGCHLDRHENIGKGNIGLDGFQRIMNEPKFSNIPMILETPPGLSDQDEIEILYKLCK